MSQLELYDLARRGSNTSWSYNVWKTRLALNYKNIAYTTVWVDHDTLTPTLRSLGVPANTSGQGFEYTVPTVTFPDGETITNSAAIIKKLETLYPTPSVHLDKALETEVEGAVFQAAKPLFAVYMPRVARDVIPESTIPTFLASREKMFGMPLAQAEQVLGGENAWAAAEPGLTAVKKLLTERKRDSGPWIKGSEVCYADFMLVAWFEALKRVGEDLVDKIFEWDRDGVFRRFHEAAGEWVVKDV